MTLSRTLAFTATRRTFVFATSRPPISHLIISRAASLSAIHRGLRQSDRVQGTAGRRPTESRKPQDRKPRRRSDSGESAPRSSSGLDSVLRNGRRDSRRDGRSSLTTKALAGAATPRQRAKLRKKLDKQAAKDDEEDGGKQTRRKRFQNPDEPHGKKSLVYHLKYGNLKSLADSVQLQEPVRPLSFRARQKDRREGSPRREDTTVLQRSSTMRSAAQDGRDSVDQPHRSDHGSEQLGMLNKQRVNGLRSFLVSDAKRDDEVEHHQRRADGNSSRNQRFERSNREPRDPNDAAVDRARKGGLMPLTVKYTTAASQFLYGRSVVKSALSQSRRKLYNLYIYANEARIDKKDDEAIRNLAKYRKVPITVVPEGEQRLMDKMSTGRPHNGYVLETSPLPQLPVTGLGALVETAETPGYSVTLGHQTKEELAINGEDTFVPRANSSTPKPLVLLLNEILDPGNLGGLIRTARYLGVDAIGITSRSSSTLTPVVLKSAAGAVEEVTIFTVENPVDFIVASKAAGWRAFAAVAPPERKLSSMHHGKFLSTEDVEARDPLSQDPCILVLGNEGHGLTKHIKVASDYEVSVPRFMHGSSGVDSLNVSVAAGLLCHSFVRGSAAKTRRTGTTGAVNLEPMDAVSRQMRENARELW